MVTRRRVYASIDCHVSFVPHQVKITRVGTTLGALNLKMILEHIASFFIGLTTLSMIVLALMLTELKTKNKLLEDQLCHKEAIESRLHFLLIALYSLCLALFSMLMYFIFGVP
jgi:hypothetical protein